MSNLKIVFIQRQFSHYRKAIFDELNKYYKIYLLHSGVDSTIKGGKAVYAIKVKYFKYWKKVTNIFQFVYRELVRIKPEIVVHEANPSILSLPLVFIYCQLKGAKFVLWGHGYNRRKGFNPQKSFTSKIRYWYMKHADAILVYEQKGKKELGHFVDTNKIFVAQNTIDTRKLLQIRNLLDKKGKSKLKKELRFRADFNLVFIGRLLPEKRPFDAVKIFERIKSEFIDKTVNLHIIGDGPEFNKLKGYINENKLKSEIKMYGAMYDDYEVGKILYASDLLINPGYVGLNVNHTFCFDLPVFTFSQGEEGPFHSPEVEFITDGETGFFSKPFDYNEMVKKIVYYLSSPQLQCDVKAKIKRTAENVLTIENMVKGFHNCFNYLLKNEK